MNEHALQSNANSMIPRTFARLTAHEVTRSDEEQNKSGLFLTIITDCDRPEPEHGILG
jgi:hypothetical protein